MKLKIVQIIISKKVNHDVILKYRGYNIDNLKNCIFELMRNLLFFFSILICVLMSSCANDLDLIAPRQDIPIVYALISPADSAQYIRVERAFVDESTSALEIARRPDSLYYSNATIQLQRNSTGEIYTFDQVNAADEGYEREDGAFASTPNILYKFITEDMDLRAGEDYTLLIDRGIEGLDQVSSEATMVSTPLITRPTSSGTIDFDYVQDFNIRWQKNDNNKIFDVDMIVNYVERDLSNLSAPVVNKSVVWQVGSNIEEEELRRVGKDFYSFLAGAIEEDVQKARFFQNITVVVYVGGQELLDLVRIGRANLGITSSNEIPQYSNLSEGLGVFTARNRVIKENVVLSIGTIDSLRNGSITGNLNFQ